MSRRRVYILANPAKPEVPAGLEELRHYVVQHADLVGVALNLDPQPALAADAEFLMVLGGDGTLLTVARALGDQQIPLIGVNFGKLGFLTQFDVAQLEHYLPAILHNGDLIAERTMLDIEIVRAAGEEPYRSLCVNDCVIHAGPPFRIIDLQLELDGRELTRVRGDGLIVCTPTGSTAHNMSAGGPLLMADVAGIVITPLNPHSFTHRPVVVSAASRLKIHAEQVNGGTTAIIDGQASCALGRGDRIHVRESATRWRMVRNPTVPTWHNLVAKLRWGRHELS
jgi:NAD+ kinase